jgi:serine/threonine protein kinase
MEARTGQLMAVKEVMLDSQDDKDDKFRKSLQNEIDLLKDIKHPRIVQYLGHDYLEGRLYIYLEYMPGNSISQVLSQFGALDEPLCARYTHHLLEGLEYLHTRDPPVLHRDVKGANILVGLDRTVKLSDFGCSKRSFGTAIHTLRGSIPWMAPEVMTQTVGYGRKADIWSLGCVLIEMTTAETPWGTFDNHLAAMVRIAMSEETPPVPQNLSTACREFMIACTRRAPQERPDAADLLKHEFVAGHSPSSIDESWG